MEVPRRHLAIRESQRDRHRELIRLALLYVTWLAHFALRVHILKKAARRRLSERLARLLLSRGDRLSRFGLALRFLIIHIFFAGA